MTASQRGAKGRERPSRSSGCRRRSSTGLSRSQSPAGTDDGILTAEEVASLDLSGVEWAVLSACETGLGEARTGEGLFGLRRAFQLAGARTLVTSLWPVDDEASLTVLRERRAAGKNTHPFFWAGFVAAGDWR